MRRSLVVVGTVGALLVGYLGLDATDHAPGLLTTRPMPPPPPTETAGTRTLPLVPQPTPSTSVGMPLPSLAGAPDAATGPGVTAALRTVLALPALDDASLVVRDGQTGKVLLDRGGAERRIPASTTKLLSAAAISHVFGADDVLRTEVVAGATAGQVVLVAGGDSLLAPGAGDPDAVAGRAGLADLADQVAQALEQEGRTRVTLSVDTTYAAGPLLAPTWDRSFRPLGITGAVAMLGRSDQRARGGRPGPADPVASTRDLFARRLEERGVAVTVSTKPAAVARAGAAPTVLGSVESAPVGDQLALALTDSDNALTEILARQAAFRSGVGTTTAAGTTFAATGAWVRSQVAALGVDPAGVSLSDASGLSRQNRVTARLLTDVLLLGYDGSDPVLRRALAALPIGGLTGTLAGRFDTSATHDAAGRARAKTGTLTGANALAGSVVDVSGRLLVYAGLVGSASTPAARTALDRYVATLAACGCH